MRICYGKELNKRLAPYLENLIENKSSLNKETISLFDDVMKGIDYDSQYGTYNEITIPHLKRIIQKENITDIVHLADGQLGKMLHYMLGDEYTTLFRTYLKLSSRCPHTMGYLRRSQRSVNPLDHLDHLHTTFCQFLKLCASGLTVQEILFEENKPKDIEDNNNDLESEAWLAAQIAQGNQTVINYLNNVLTSENNINRLRHVHLRAIAISGYHPLLELEGKLLLAARLQEGLRQAIVETMDEGCPESFLYLFSIIYDNNLQRYASVKRSIAVCTGLGEQDNSEREIKKYIELIHSFLNNMKLARKAIQSNDTVEIYIALWSIGFYNTEALKSYALELIRKGAKYQVQTLLWFLRCTQSETLNFSIAKKALEIWHNDPAVVVAIIPLYMNNVNLYRHYNNTESLRLDDYFDSEKEAIRHYKYLVQIYQSIPARVLYSPYIFSFASIELTHSDIVQRMAYIAWMTDNASLKDDLCSYLPALDSYIRSNYMELAMNPPTSKFQEEYLLQSMGDRTEYVRSAASQILSEMNLTPEQYQKLEELLRYKYSEMRINAINLLMKQPKEQLADSIHRLLSDKNAERRLAGLDMMKKLHNIQSLQCIYPKLLSSVEKIQKPNTKEKILIESLLGDGTEKAITSNYSRDNGFCLYNPVQEINLPEIAQEKEFNVQKAFEFIRSKEAIELFRKLDAYIEKHKDDEFKNSFGDTRQVSFTVISGWYTHKGLKELGLGELWKSFYENEIKCYDKLLMMHLMLNLTNPIKYKNDLSIDELSDIKSFGPIVNKLYDGIMNEKQKIELCKLVYYKQISDIIMALAHDYRDETVYQNLSVNMLLQLLTLLNSQNIFRKYISNHEWLNDKQTWGEKEIVYPIHHSNCVNFWLENPEAPIDDFLFTRYFTVRYQLYKRTNYMEYTPEPKETDAYIRSVDFARAWMLGLIPKEEVYRELIGRTNSPSQIEEITMVLFDSYRHSGERTEFTDIKNINFSSFRPLVQQVIDRILEIELKRGDTETQVTKLATELRCIYGAEVFIRILQSLGKDNIVRDSYGWSNNKRGVLSRLLHRCYPSPDDTSTILKKLAKEAEITDERLVEGAMFAPQWLELTEKAIGWKGLSSTAYYFRAHTSESCDEKEKAIIARYSPIDVNDLQRGAFDIEWFKDAYKTIGKQRFEIVYNAAKYISSSNGHTRARKFADAVSGKLKVDEVKKEITEKRNKDLLMSYGLIPFGRKANSELLERYQFIQKFLKQSKELGAQRQESEKRAANIALQNLARNSGYGDITRLTWSMETELIKEMLPYFTPTEIEGIEVHVQVNKEGKSELKQVKAGKELNSLPSKLKKQPYIEELKEVHSKLKDQYIRSRVMLEQAMENSTCFEECELRKLMQNPVIWPLLKNLVFTCEKHIGFYDNKQLITGDGTCLPLDSKTELRIAHPTDFYTNGQWATYQKLLFDKTIRQPFKQVFRELYIPTPEEGDATQSRRYAGNQIQPKKTIAVLKGHRWVADYENGLQKIYYKENIIATIYALADWFSPADIEAPTLEYVCFYNRKNGELMKISEIPPIIFSEVMRDVDLAVSVAHVGSVDPETSHSSIEMRRVLVEQTMPLFHISNVIVKESFAHIDGKLGKYNIHLGSGVIHQEGGAQIAVLPVHSQSRGRLFLPFVDEDPKTAEILTKILFFADDEKIKDPSILNQIK